VTGSTLQAPGYAGEGLYEVLAAHGLNIRISPDTRQQPIGTLQQGESCTVIDSPTANGWIPVHNDAVQGYVCLSCAEAPGGPWLAQIAVLGDYALANAAANALGL
jgi:uncharacterized protein YgiM (DUF1202 family)